MVTPNYEELRRHALNYLFLQNRDWIQMAEEGDPIFMVDGHGIEVTDSTGKTWIDVNGGFNSVNVGYGRAEIAKAAYEQMVKLPYFPSGTTTVPTIKLAQKLADITPGSLSRVFPVSGGSEANETALKIARAYHRRRGEPGRYKVISRKGSYHGMSGGVVWLGDTPAFPRSDFGPAYPGMVYAPQPNHYHCELGGETPSECAVRCATAVEDLIKFHGPETVAAFIGEPVAISKGTSIPGDEYWPMIREICDRYGVVMICDEIINGFGRTGKMFAIEHCNIVPDILCVAKGIVSSYLPMGAAIVKEEIADHFAGKDNIFQHVLTFSGHPVSAAASLKNIEIIENEGLVQNSAETGAYFLERLRALQEDHPTIVNVRGLGLLLTLELVDRKTGAPFPPEVKMGARLNEKFREHGLIFWARNELMSIGPPLCITRDEIDRIVRAVDLSLGEVESELGISKNY